MNKIICYFILLSFLIFFTSCNQNENTETNMDTDVLISVSASSPETETNLFEPVLVDSENPAATISNKEIAYRFEELLNNLDKYERFLNGCNIPVLDDEGNKIIIKDSFYKYYKIEPEFSVDELKKAYSKYYIEPKLSSIYNKIDNMILEKEDGLYYFNKSDTTYVENIFYPDTISIILRRDNIIIITIEVSAAEKNYIREYTFEIKDNSWYISDGGNNLNLFNFEKSVFNSPVYIDLDNPAATVTNEEVAKRFNEMYNINSDFFKCEHFLYGGSVPVLDDEGNKIIVEYSDYSYYKIEPEYSPAKLKEVFSKYCTGNYLNTLYDNIDKWFREEEDGLYFIMADALPFGVSTNYFPNTISVFMRRNDTVMFAVEGIAFSTEQRLYQFIFTIVNGVWYLSEYPSFIFY